MILIKRRSCGKETLELIIQTDREIRVLQEFTNLIKPLIVEIVTHPERMLPDIVIRKVLRT